MLTLGAIFLMLGIVGTVLGLVVSLGDKPAQYWHFGRTWPENFAPQIYQRAGVFLVLGAIIIILSIRH